MSLSNYVGASSGLCLELKENLTKENINALKSELSAMGLQAYHSWFYKHQAEIAEYLAITPSQRKKKKYQERPDILLLIFGALKLAYIAHDFLSAIVDNDIRPGGSYRDTAAVAGRAGYDYYLKAALYWHQKEFWPFEDEFPFK